MVTPAERHKYLHDRFLRSMGYGFVLWGCVNLLLTGPVIARATGLLLPFYVEGLYLIAILAAGVWAHRRIDCGVERRVGPAADVLVMRSDIVWGVLLLSGTLLTLVILHTGPFFLIQIIWPIVVGSGYAIWGLHSIRPMAYLGFFIVFAGAAGGLLVSVPQTMDPSRPIPVLVVNYVIIMGLLWLPFGFYLQRTYLRIGPLEDRADQRTDMAA